MPLAAPPRTPASVRVHAFRAPSGAARHVPPARISFRVIWPSSEYGRSLRRLEGRGHFRDAGCKTAADRGLSGDGKRSGRLVIAPESARAIPSNVFHSTLAAWV